MTGVIDSPAEPATVESIELVEHITPPGLRIEVSAPEFADEADAIATDAYALGISWGWEQGARRENEVSRAVFKRLAEALESGALHEGTPARCAAAGHEIIAKAIREATEAQIAKSAPRTVTTRVTRDPVTHEITETVAKESA